MISLVRRWLPARSIFSTDPTQTAEQIVSDFMKRWSLEVTFEEGRAHILAWL